MNDTVVDDCAEIIVLVDEETELVGAVFGEGTRNGIILEFVAHAIDQLFSIVRAGDG